MPQYLFSSESVSSGHPDKIADQISDAILDAVIAQDKYARVAAETLVTADLVVLAGEITTSATVDYAQIARNTIAAIGYTDNNSRFSADNCQILVRYNTQSADIALGIGHGVSASTGAGDQGIMFGYACDETPELMPAAIHYAHRLMEQHALLRRNGSIAWLGPDAKVQITMCYDERSGKALYCDNIVLSTQHLIPLPYAAIAHEVIEQIIKPIIPASLLQSNTRYLINPTGQFIIGGPQADTGLTGRKIIVDTYGGAAAHGGGAFSGKDPTKMDRSAAYAARYVAKNIVAAGLAKQCQVQLAYAIGVSEPVNINVYTFGTGTMMTDEQLITLIRYTFDLSPRGIISTLDLLRPIYLQTAAYGHFGRAEFSWERVGVV